MSFNRKRKWYCMKKMNGSTYFKILLICIILLLFPLLSTRYEELFNAILAGNITEIRALLTDNLPSVYLFTLLIMIIQNTFTIIPLLLMITINFTLFGFVNGFIWSWLSSVLAAIIIFIAVRYMFQDWLLTKFKHELIEKIEKKGFVYVFQARIFPFVPTSFVNILAGLSSIHFKDFLLGTVAGNFLYFFVLSLIPAGLFSAKLNEYILGTILVLCLLLYYGFKKKHKQQ